MEWQLHWCLYQYNIDPIWTSHRLTYLWDQAAVKRTDTIIPPFIELEMASKRRALSMCQHRSSRDHAREAITPTCTLRAEV